MSIRKRVWSVGGQDRTAWVVDYKDQHGKRRLKIFQRKKYADAWWSGQAGYEVAQGIQTASSASMTVRQAGRHWTDAAEKDGLERSTVRQYRQHLELHIEPRLGDVKLSDLSAPMVKDFEIWLHNNDRSRTTLRATLPASCASASSEPRLETILGTIPGQ